jgi:hypothetical protein
VIFNERENGTARSVASDERGATVANEVLSFERTELRFAHCVARTLLLPSSRSA